MALHDGLAVERQEGHRLARAVVVVPNSDTRAQKGILGVEERLEGVVVDAPVAVDSSLVASCGSRSYGGLELGLADGWAANGAGLPGLELNAGDRESCIGRQDEQRRRSEGLSRSVRVVLGMRSIGKSILDWSLTLEKYILLRGQLRCLPARYYRKAACRRGIARGWRQDNTTADRVSWYLSRLSVYTLITW